MSRKSKKQKIVYEVFSLKVDPLLGVPLCVRSFRKKRKAFNYILYQKKCGLDFFMRRSIVIGEVIGMDLNTRRDKKSPLTMMLDIYFLKPGSFKLCKKK